MRLKHIEPDDFAWPVFQDFPDRHEIARALAHLLAFDLQEAVVHPVVRHHVGAVRAARLRNLVFMMRED